MYPEVLQVTLIALKTVSSLYYQAQFIIIFKLPKLYKPINSVIKKLLPQYKY